MLLKLIKVTVQAAAIAAALKATTYKNMSQKQLLRLIAAMAVILFAFEMVVPLLFVTKKLLTKFDVRFEDGLENVYAKRKGFVEGFDEDPKLVRLNNVLYSGDIVFINSANNASIATPTTATTATTTATPATTTPPAGTNAISSIQRNATSSEVLLAPPMNGIQSNLSKLRIESSNHDPQVLKPIRYGDTVYIKHNANVNNANTSLFVKISDELVSHQTGPLFNQFIISNAANAQDTGFVQPGANIVISNLASGGISSGFLLADGATRKITNSATSAATATQFTIQLERVVEIGDKHLCICVGDILYP